jgi:hypothetical protein
VVSGPVEGENYDLMERPKVEEEVPEQVEQPPAKQQRSSYASNYIDNSSIVQIEEMLSEGQLEKMLRRLEEDIQGLSQAVLISNFKENFAL